MHRVRKIQTWSRSGCLTMGDCMDCSCCCLLCHIRLAVLLQHAIYGMMSASVHTKASSGQPCHHKDTEHLTSGSPALFVTAATSSALAAHCLETTSLCPATSSSKSSAHQEMMEPAPISKILFCHCWQFKDTSTLSNTLCCLLQQPAIVVGPFLTGAGGTGSGASVGR